jgi:hypothetical protein
MIRPNIPKFTSIRPPFIPRTIINQRVVDSTIIAKLFLICQEGIISNIKEYILSKGLTANDIVNTDGQSILHVILLNDSISPRDKTDIFKFLASRNLLKFSYDSQQKTPLHIAAEKQLTEIVKILINASHDVNAIDSTKRTPIYYAIAGTEVECPKKQQPQLIEKKKTYKISLQDELNQEIVKFINDNKNIKNLLLHLYNTTKNLDSIYYDEITKVLNDDNKKIMEILIEEKDEEKKKEKIFEKVYETRNSIINMFIKEKFTSTLKPISFNKVDANTWGPDANPVNKFLNDVEPIVILKDFELDYDKQKSIVIQDLEKIFAKNNSDFIEIKDKYFQGIENGIYDLNFYSILYDILKKYSSQSLSGGSRKHNKTKHQKKNKKSSSNQKKNKKSSSNQKIIKKVVKKYVQTGGANPAEITQVITFMTANIPGLSGEAEILSALPQVIGKMIDSDSKFIRRFTRVPINSNFLGQIYAQVIEINNTLVTNAFIYQELNRDVNILDQFIRHSNDLIAEKIAETIYNTYQVHNAILNPLPIKISTALEAKPLILIHLVGFNGGQLFPTLTANLINVINNHNDLFEDINFVGALNSTLKPTKFPTLISGNGPLRVAIDTALSRILRIDYSFIYDKLLIVEYQNNNELLKRLINELMLILIDIPLIRDPRLINLLQNNKQLFEKILEKFNTANLPRLGLTPQQITDLTTLFVSSLIHYDLTDMSNAQLNTNYLAIDPALLNPIQAILNNPILVTNLKNAYNPHPTIALITARFAQFQPDDETKRALTQVLNNIPPININDLDELAKLFSEAIKLTREIILNPTFINFIITNQQLLLKIIELQAGNDINIYAIFQYSMNVNGSQIGSRDPTKQYLIDNYQIVENLIDMRRNIPINILIDLIREILQTPNAATFINDIITSQRLLAYLKNNKPLTAELVILVRLAPLLLPIAKLLCVIDDNHTNIKLVENLVQNPNLLIELVSVDLRTEIAGIMSIQNIAELVGACINRPRSILSTSRPLIDKIKTNFDLSIKLLDSTINIPVEMVSNIIVPLLEDFKTLAQPLKDQFKLNLSGNIPVLIEIIKNNKNTTSIKILTEILFEYFNTNPGRNNLKLLVPAFIENKNQLYNLIDTDNSKNLTNPELIRKAISYILVKVFETDKIILTDKTIRKSLLDEKSIVNYVIHYLAESTVLLDDEKADYIKPLILKNNVVESDKLLELNANIILKIIGSDYNTNQDLTTIGSVILILIEKENTYFDVVFDQLVLIIKDTKPELLQVLVNRQFTTHPEHYTFVAKLLNRIFELQSNFLESNKVIKTILLNNPKLMDIMNKLKAQPVAIVGHITKDNLENICKYDGSLQFTDHRINDQTVYDLNTLTDEVMVNPTKPIVKFNDDFFSEYEQLITDHQTDFIRFNNGTNFIRKIKIIHSKISLIYNDIETIIGRIKTEFTKQLQTINIKVLFEELVLLNSHLISLVNYLTLFYAEFNLIKEKTNKIITALREEVKSLKTENKSINLPSKNKKIEYHLFYESLLKIFEKIDSSVKNDVAHDLYKNVVELQESLNKSINFINYVSATKYIIAFNNGLTEFNEIIKSGAANPIENIFNRNISLFPKLYSKFDTILSEQTQNVQTDKLNLVTKFIPQLTQYNFFSYYQAGMVNPASNPRIGFIVPQNYLNRTILNDEPKLTYGKTGITDKILNADISNANNLLQYKLGIINGFPANRILTAFNSVNLLLDKHFLIIKNFVIRKLIEELYKILQNKKRGIATAGKELLEDLLQKTYNEIKTNLNLPEDNLQLFLTMLAKNIDQILINNFTNFILNGITRFGFREIRHKELKKLLDGLAEIKIPGAADDSLIQIVHTELEQLTKPNDIVAVIKADPNAYRIEYEEPVLVDKIIHVTKLKPIGINDINVDKCFKTDLDLIKLLIGARASVNTLINNAIESNNPDIVKLLIDSSSVYNEKSKDINGQRPYDLAIAQIKYFGSVIDQSLIQNLIDESLLEISKKTSLTLQMRYHDLFYKIFYVLFNHLLLDLTNQMKYENKKKLRHKLKFTKEAFPLKDYINWDTMIKKPGDDYVKDKTNVINEVVEIEIKDNSEKIRIKRETEEKIHDLINELNDSEDKPTPIRKQIIEDELRELQEKLLSLSGLTTIKQEISKDKIKLRKENNKYSQDIIKNKIKKLVKEKDFMKMYESLDDKVFDKDIKTVNNVWSSIFKKYKLNELNIDIMSRLSKYIQNETKFDDIYEELNNFLKITTKFASDYVELDQQLHSENYALERIYELLSYIIKHTISINLKNIIQQLLRSELTRITPQQTMITEKYSELIDEKVKAIIISSKLDEYIDSKLIDKIIITTFNLDTTDKIELQQHFEYITKQLSLNGIIPITNDSEIIRILSNNIYPYFTIYTEINLKKLKMIISGIFNILSNLNNSFDIYLMIANKAKIEK